MKNFTIHKHKFLLLLLIVFLILTNLIWYNCGHKPIHWDSSIHLSLSVDAYKTFAENISGSSFINKMLGISWYYPPLVYYVSVPFYYLLGTDELTGLIEINFFLILLVCAVYLLGSRLYNKSAGLFGAFCISMYPIVMEYSRDYMLDLPLAALVAISAYLLLRTENFTKPAYCILAGISLGCGMLIKWSFIFFLIPPLLFFVFQGMKIKDHKLRVVSDFLLTIFISLVISLPWYLKNLIMIFSTRSGELGRSDLTLLQSVFYYFRIIPQQISFLIAILFVASIILFLIRKKARLNYFLLFWLIGSYIIITLIKIKAPRFSISLLIPMTLLFSGIIFSDSLTGKRKFYVSLFIFVGLLQYLIISFSGIKINYSIPVFDTPVLSEMAPVKFENYNLKVLDLIEEDRIKNKKERSVLRVIPDEQNFNNSTLKYYAKIKDCPLTILGLSGFPLFTDYVVVKTGVSESLDNKRTTITDGLMSDTSRLSGIFKTFDRVRMQDGNELVLFKPDVTVDTSVNTDLLKTRIFSSFENFLKKYLRTKNGFSYDIIFNDTVSALSGNIKSIKIFTEEAEFGDFSFKETGLKVNKFGIDITELDYAMQSLLRFNSMDILSMKGLEINSLEISATDLKNYIERSTDNKVLVKNISFENNLIRIEGHSNQLNTDFLLVLRILQTEDTNLIFKIEKCRIFNVCLPDFLLNYMLGNYNPLIKGMEFIKDFKLNKFEINDNKIMIRKDLK
ncbi:MAG: glycosyltransferase family 39 protein [bacterium]|nr:glycosyltransferase family 39 protein [bacterium]